MEAGIWMEQQCVDSDEGEAAACVCRSEVCVHVCACVGEVACVGVNADVESACEEQVLDCEEEVSVCRGSTPLQSAARRAIIPPAQPLLVTANCSQRLEKRHQGPQNCRQGHCKQERGHCHERGPAAAMAAHKPGPEESRRAQDRGSQDGKVKSGVL